jgi:glutamate receptor, ionotropic, plant
VVYVWNIIYVDYFLGQVYIQFQSYDGIVADMTITAERSMFIDFTLPYKQSGISIVAPAVEDQGSKRAWVFTKPLRPGLWAVIAAFFIFTGIIIWIMEHRFNEEFRGPWWRHNCTIISFAFSTLVYAHSNLFFHLISSNLFIYFLKIN